MSIIKTFLALVVSWAIGCENKLINQAVSPCEQAALNHCISMGYERNRLCFLVFAKQCSTGNESEAHKECLRIVGEVSTSKAECILRWP